MSGRGERVDVLLVERGCFESRARAQAAVMEGAVYVDGRRVIKAGRRISPDVRIEVKGRSHPYVSRGGLKIERPMELFPIQVSGRVALDAGASTGGFTDFLLRRGAGRVYAVDVGYGQLDWRLRQDARVVVMERTNVRYLTPDQVGEPVDLVTADLSFISLRKVLGPLGALLREGGEMLALVKPQFEAGRGKVGRRGVVRDSRVRADTLEEALRRASELRLVPRGLTYSPVRGPKGNLEFWMWLHKMRAGDPSAYGAEGSPPKDLRAQVSNVVAEAERATESHDSAPRG